MEIISTLRKVVHDDSCSWFSKMPSPNQTTARIHSQMDYYTHVERVHGTMFKYGFTLRVEVSASTRFWLRMSTFKLGPGLLLVWDLVNMDLMQWCLEIMKKIIEEPGARTLSRHVFLIVLHILFVAKRTRYWNFSVIWCLWLRWVE